VGERGQARIARAAVDVPGGTAGEVAARYLAGAGVACVRAADDAALAAARAIDPEVAALRVPRNEAAQLALPAEAEAALASFVSPAARSVAEGSFTALFALKLAIAGSEA
jgi:hypothetical protein